MYNQHYPVYDPAITFCLTAQKFAVDHHHHHHFICSNNVNTNTLETVQWYTVCEQDIPGSYEH